MNNEKKLMFLQNMTHMALQHMEKTPNQPTQDGKMSHDKKMAFVSAVAKHGLQHLDAGGTALSGPTQAGPASNTVNNNGLVGTVGNILGQNNNFQGTGAQIQNGTNVNQLNTAYSGANGAINQQQGITNTLNGGLSQGANSENNLTNLYTNQANGTGPKPAQAQLNQATGENIAQQAALAAGQRGAGANAGLIARQNAQQGAATQQNAAGQAATMQAQQQLAAEQNLQNLASSQVAQGQGATSTLNNANQNEQNILQGANTSANNANVSQQSNLNNVNASVAAGNQSQAGNILGGLGSLASNIPLIGRIFAKGGMVKAPQNLAMGGISGEPTQGQSFAAQWLNSSPDTQSPMQQQASANPISSPTNGFSDVPTKDWTPKTQAQAIEDSGMGGSGDVETGLAGAGEGAGAASGIGDPSVLPAYKGGLMKKGGMVNPHNSNQRAIVQGDSLKNDKVPAMLSQGELVIDRETMMDKGPMGQMARALAAHIQRKNGKK